MKKMVLLLIALFVVACGQGQKEDKAKNEKSTNPQSAQITFVELGSVNCIPCKAMQPVMKSIEEEFGDQIKVIFYDVWQAEQKKYAQEYKIRVIPTQVFLDKNGVEFHRHEGFYAREDIAKLLVEKGLKPKTGAKS